MSGFNVDVNDIIDLAAREGNEYIKEQVNLKAPLRKALKKKPMKGNAAIINISGGGNPSVAQVEDFGLLPEAASIPPAQGIAKPAAFVARLGLGRIALKTLAGVDDSADLLDTQLKGTAADMARQVGRAYFGSQLSSPAASAGTITNASSTTTIVATFLAAASDFRVGEAYIYEPDTVADTQAYPVLCTQVAFSAVSDDTVVCTFIIGAGAVPGYTSATLATEVVTVTSGNVLATDKFFLRGSRVVPVAGATSGVVVRGNANPNMVDLPTIVSSVSSLHGLAASANGWSGNSVTVSGVFTPEQMMAKSKRLQVISGEAADMLVLSTLASGMYAASNISNGTFGSSSFATQPRRVVDGKLGKYGKNGDMDSALDFFGREVVVDPNCPSATAYMLNSDWLELGVWSEMQAEDEGGSPLLLSRTTFSKEVQYACIENLICRKRNAHMAVSGFTIA